MWPSIKEMYFAFSLALECWAYLAMSRKTCSNGKKQENGSMKDQRSGKTGLARKDLRE